MITKTSDWQRAKLQNQSQDTEDISNKVSQMLEQIRIGGDRAIERFADLFDQQKPQLIALKPFDDYPLDADLAASIKFAAKRIEDFANFQLQSIKSADFSDDYGNFGQIIHPIERIGAYIPAGRYPLISTALMTLIPAKVAASSIRIACSPSSNQALLAAASLAGATEFLQIGGVQAIAALAYGYGQQTAVDLVVGPGNIWVNEAKKQLQSLIKIDGLAGPSELLILCDDKQPIEWLALDALAQAEHDPLACSIIVSDSQSWLESMANYLQGQRQFCTLLENRQIELIHGDTKAELVAFSEAYAPEHLMLCHAEIQPEAMTNFGSLFIGANSAVALGDYITGPNHTLPTQGFSRQTGGLSVSTFLRIQTVQRVSDQGRKKLAEHAMPIANAEGLVSHYDSLKIRLD